MAEKAMVAPRVPFSMYTPDTAVTYLKVGVYGKPGVGKTTLAATAPAPLFINVEAGTTALIGMDVDVHIVDVDEFAELQKVYEFLRDSDHGFESVIIDSVTELQQKGMDSVLSGQGRDYPQMQDWGRNLEQIRRVIRSFRDLDMHVVCIFGEREREETTPLGQTVTVAHPNLPGKLGGEIAGYFDVFGQMIMNPVKGKPGHYEHGMRVRPGPRWMGKDRTGVLDPVILGDELNITRMVERVQSAQRKGGGDVIDTTLEGGPRDDD